MTDNTIRRRRTHDETPFVCRRCGGPARTYRGNVHRWTCQRCIDLYIEHQLGTHP